MKSGQREATPYEAVEDVGEVVQREVGDGLDRDSSTYQPQPVEQLKEQLEERFKLDFAQIRNISQRDSASAQELLEMVARLLAASSAFVPSSPAMLTRLRGLMFAPEVAPGANQEPEQKEQEGAQPETDPRKNRLPKIQVPPEVMEEQIRQKFIDYAESYPDIVRDFAQALVKEAEKLGLPSKKRTLGLTQAANLIGINHNQLKRYFDDPDIQIGAVDEHGRPVFSEYECLTFVPPSRGRGRPKKQA